VEAFCINGKQYPPVLVSIERLGWAPLTNPGRPIEQTAAVA
jgi:hypothetical protein